MTITQKYKRLCQVLSVLSLANITLQSAESPADDTRTREQGVASVSKSARDDSRELQTNQDGEIVTLEEFTVTATAGVDPYLAADSSTAATRSSARTIETPFNISSFSPELIDDFGLLDDEETLSFSGGTATGTSSSTIRGFKYKKLVDGFTLGLTPTRANQGGKDVVKGPMSVQYGRTAPGGIMNQKTRRPMVKPKYTFSTSYNTSGVPGSWDAFVNATGPLSSSPKIYYYAAFTYSHSDSTFDVDWSESDSKSAYLSFLWVINRKTFLTVSATYQPIENDVPSFTTSTQPIEGAAAGTPGHIQSYGGGGHRDSYNTAGSHSTREYGFKGYSVIFERQITNNMDIRAALQGYSRKTDKDFWTGGTVLYLDTMRHSSRQPRVGDDLDEAIGFQVDFNTKFRTGSMQHRFLVSVDGSHVKTETDERIMPNPKLFFTYDQLNLTHGSPLNDISFDKKWVTESVTLNTLKQDTFGALASYTLALLKNRWINWVSFRYDKHEDEYDDKLNVTTSGKGDGGKGTYSIGSVYKIYKEDLVAYASISTGYEPQKTVDKGLGRLTKPFESKGYEFGLKGNSPDRKWNYTWSFFWLEQSNVFDSNPMYNGNIHGGQNTEPQYLYGGVQQAYGTDLELVAKPISPLTVRLNFSYVKSKTAANEDTPWVVGKPMEKVAPYSASFMATYNLNAILKGLSVGMSGDFTDKYIFEYATWHKPAPTITNPNPDRDYMTRYEKRMPSSFLMKMFLKYTFKTGNKMNHSFLLRANNLLDREYYNYRGYQAWGREYTLQYSLVY